MQNEEDFAKQRPCNTKGLGIAGANTIAIGQNLSRFERDLKNLVLFPYEERPFS
jgi:hypothetical protein